MKQFTWKDVIEVFWHFAKRDLDTIQKTARILVVSAWFLTKNMAKLPFLWIQTVYHSVKLVQHLNADRKLEVVSSSPALPPPPPIPRRTVIVVTSDMARTVDEKKAN